MAQQDYKRLARKFLYRGLNLLFPVDLVPIGKFPFVQNIRSYIDGEMRARPGLTAINAVAIAGQALVHSIKRLNDDSSGTSVAARIVGAGTRLYHGLTGFTEAFSNR